MYEARFIWNSGYWIKETSKKDVFRISTLQEVAIGHLLKWKRDKVDIENEKKKKYHYR
jgi:hypothetical protein